MKEVTNYRKSKIYSDIEPKFPFVTFLEYMGNNDEFYCFRYRGGSKSYLQEEKEGFGRCISFRKKNGMFPISATQLKKLIEQGKITVQ